MSTGLFTLFSLVWTSLLFKRHPFFLNISIVLFIIGLLLLWQLWKYLQSKKIIQLEISHKGDLLLRYLDIHGNPEKIESEVVQLKQKTVLLPFVLIIELKTYRDDAVILLIFPDSVDNITFRKLSVALRWISTRSHE